MDRALINNDGYWVRASDYSLYLDERGRFHLIPHDTNETFSRPGGPGFGRGRGDTGQSARVRGVELDPLHAANDGSKPLLSKLLAVPAWRAKYLGYVRDIAERWLNWATLGPIAQRYHALIAADVKADTRKLNSHEKFLASLDHHSADIGDTPEFRGPGGPKMSLKDFADQRRAYLLKQTERK